MRKGIQTLALRLERQQENAADVAKYLLAHPLVKKVYYPGLTDGEDLAAKGLRGAGGVLSFEVVDGINPADVLNNLRLFRLAVSLGAVESLAELPCRMTHFELPREERLKVGITDELIRLAIGTEDALSQRGFGSGVREGFGETLRQVERCDHRRCIGLTVTIG